jgi:hypothetical protein
MNTQDSENEGCYVSPPVTEQGADMQGRIGEIARPVSATFLCSGDAGRFPTYSNGRIHVRM